MQAALMESDDVDRDRLSPEKLAAANINPTTRLATDYLNHYNNAVMLLDVLPAMPECAAEIEAWQPIAYEDYFSHSHFRERDLAISAYRRADPAVRRAFDAAVSELDTAMLETRHLVLSGDPADPVMAAELHRQQREYLQPLIARTSAIVNGAGSLREADLDVDAAQNSVDQLFP
jgi:hypothetical protein